MSIKALSWAADTDLLGKQKWVLMALANYASDADATCYPGQETLARFAGVSVRTVRDALTQLEADGWIVRTRRNTADGFRTSDHFRLVMEARNGGAAGSAGRPEEARNSGAANPAGRPDLPADPAGQVELRSTEPSELAGAEHQQALLQAPDEEVLDVWADAVQAFGAGRPAVGKQQRDVVRRMLREGVPAERLVQVIRWAFRADDPKRYWATGLLKIGGLRKHWATMHGQCPPAWQPPEDVTVAAQRVAAHEARVLERTLQHAGMTEGQFLALSPDVRLRLTWAAEEAEQDALTPPPALEYPERPLGRQAAAPSVPAGAGGVDWSAWA